MVIKVAFNEKDECTLHVKTDEENQLYLWKKARDIIDEVCVKVIRTRNNAVTFISFDYSIKKDERTEPVKFNISYDNDKKLICTCFTTYPSIAKKNRCIKAILCALPHFSKHPITPTVIEKVRGQLTTLKSTVT